MIHYGDITKIHGDQVPAVHVITGGSPCQDLSVAGKRAGLAGERSGLFMEQIRIVKEMRENDRRNYAGADNADRLIRPRFMVWENVPGAFSSNKGEDFRAVLEETAKVADKDAVIPEPPNGKWSHSGCIMGDGWSIAWRVHDAQFWGVPQRRKRIALVADFGGECAPEILFERESVSGNTEKSRKEGQETAGDAGAGIEETGGAISFQERAGCPGGGKGILIQNERTGALSTLNNQPVCFEPGAMSRVGGHIYGDDKSGTVRANAGDNQQAVCLNSWDVQSKHIQPENGIAESLYAGECRGGGGESYVMQSQVKEWCDAVNAEAKHQQDLIQSDLGVARTLAPGTHASGPHLTKTLITSKVYGISSFDSNGMKSANPNSGIYEADTSRTLDNNGGNPACNQGGMVVLEGNGQRESHKGDGYKESDTMYTLNSTEHHAVCIENHPADSRVKIADDGKVQTLSGRMGTGGGNVPMVMEPHTFSDVAATLLEAYGSKGVHSQMMKNPEQNFVLENEPIVGSKAQFFMHNPSDGKALSLVSTDYKDPQIVAYGIDSYNQTASEEITESLRSADGGDSKPKVCYGLDRASYNQGANAKYDFSIEEEKISTQVSRGPGAVCSTSIVRRLTPLECTRLQGFPDGWVDIGEWVDSKGKVRKDSDANKYKALGNSIALPFWEWMAKRMIKVLNVEHPTMASLFDGIGGFPLSYSRAGCEPVWASEIEEFPIAVTKVRFPEKGEEK